MPNKKKPKRKYNPAKGQALKRNMKMKVVDSLLRDLALGFVHGRNENHAEFFSMKEMCMTRADYELCTTLVLTKFTWNCYIAVFCRDQHGCEYSQGVWVESQKRCIAQDLEPLFAEITDQLIKEGNPQHYIAHGWFATPSADPVSDELANKLLDKAGSHAGLAKWECNQVEQVKGRIRNE